MILKKTPSANIVPSDLAMPILSQWTIFVIQVPKS